MQFDELVKENARLQAEVERLKQVAIDRKNELTKLCTKSNYLQSELTKVRELLRDINDAPGGSSFRKHIEALLSNQSAPADKGQGEEIVFGCSRCGGTQEEWSAKCIHCHPADQPAPVAAVMPELISTLRMVKDNGGAMEQFEWDRIDACLDEFARLNSEPKP